jgi:hypothetical protein
LPRTRKAYSHNLHINGRWRKFSLFMLFLNDNKNKRNSFTFRGSESFENIDQSVSAFTTNEQRFLLGELLNVGRVFLRLFKTVATIIVVWIEFTTILLWNFWAFSRDSSAGENRGAFLNGVDDEKSVNCWLLFRVQSVGNAGELVMVGLLDWENFDLLRRFSVTMGNWRVIGWGQVIGGGICGEWSWFIRIVLGFSMFSWEGLKFFEKVRRFLRDFFQCLSEILKFPSRNFEELPRYPTDVRNFRQEASRTSEVFPKHPEILAFFSRYLADYPTDCQQNPNDL